MKRIFIPGSEWLYLKLYTGHKSADNILIYYLYPMGMDLKAKGLITDFFFIRYTDPNFHIRFRIKIDNVLNYGEVFQSLLVTLTPCIGNGLITSVQCDTYERELERYGMQYIDDIENIFCIDSCSIIELLQELVQHETSEDDRWRLALLLIDNMMSGFGYGLEEKRMLMEIMSMNFKNEFGFTSSFFTRQLNTKYRNVKGQIYSVLEGEDIGLRVYNVIINNRQKAILDIVSKFEHDIIAKNNLLYSLIHMTMNRMFRSQNRLHELVIYDFLFKYYQSKIAREKYAK